MPKSCTLFCLVHIKKRSYLTSRVLLAQSAGNWRKTHTHMDRTHHWHPYINTVKPRCAKRHLSYYFSVFSCFRNPPNSDMDYRILSCVSHHSCACVYTRGLGTPTAGQHSIFESEKHTCFLCSWQNSASVLWISSPTLYQLSPPSPQILIKYQNQQLALRWLRYGGSRPGKIVAKWRYVFEGHVFGAHSNTGHHRPIMTEVVWPSG